MGTLLRLVLKSSAPDYLSFKDSVFSMDADEFSEVYRRTSDTHDLQGETDLNDACLERLLADVRSTDVLDVGCGRGLLADRLSHANKVTACDILVSESLERAFPDVTFRQANIESLPFADNEFDTVVCTHTLEHVQNLQQALGELRRVARRHLIIVVPRQRPYKYNFNLHTQFFPYRWSLESAFGYRDGVSIERLGDWYYSETLDGIVASS